MKFIPKANVIFTYHKDLAKSCNFYEHILGLEMVVDQGWCKIYKMTDHAFIGLVDHLHGTHKPNEIKPVIVGFVTPDLDRIYAHLQANNVTIFKPLKQHDAIGVRGFMALDPEGYTLEFEDFLDSPRNTRIREILNK
jgi:predicted enzyme related to lactoylglutathione lyase